MLKLNPGERYPGAFYVASDVVTQGECCLGQSVEALAGICVAIGVAYSIIGGEIFMEITTPDLLDECQGDAPTISGVSSDEFLDASPVNILGADFGAVQGEVWVGNAASYAGSMLLVEQTVDTWADDDIDITTVQGAFPTSPPPAWLYVLNACGRPNLVGFPITWIDV